MWAGWNRCMSILSLTDHEQINNHLLHEEGTALVNTEHW